MTDVSAISIYHLRRPLADFNIPYEGSDKVFASQRLDGSTLDSPKYEHCTFANLSFKEVIVKNGSFLNCVFIDCYFRRANLSNCRFTGSRFIECNFSHMTVKSCDFKYTVFRGSQIAYSEMEYSLPTEPNLREELTRNLAIESSKSGLSQEAKSYRMAEIKAHEENLVAAFLGKSQWYKDHFDSIARIKAFFNWLMSLINRWLWGYGENAWVLVRNLFLLSVLVFPGLFYFKKDELIKTYEGQITFLDTLYFSFNNIIPSGINSGILANSGCIRILAGLESLFGVVAVALFAAYIFRWSLRR